MRSSATSRCPECFVAEGQLHIEGCAVEECPLCGGQLIDCKCSAGVSATDKTMVATYYPETTSNYPYRNAAKRVPFLYFPRVCMKCGKVNPRIFIVPDEEWAKYVPTSIRGLHLCRKCYNEIKKVIDAHTV